MEAQIPLNLSQDDFSAIQEIALAERRKPAEVLRNLMEDIVDGKVKIDLPSEPKTKKHTTAVRVSSNLRERVVVFKDSVGLSVDKVLHLAIQKIRTQSDLH